MHPALHSWREELPSTFVRILAYLGGLVVLSIAAAHFFQSPPAIRAAPAPQPQWIEIERPFPAFALSIPEAADVPSSYAIRRHAEGGGRKDILTLGEPDGVSPYLQVEIYRPGSEIRRFAAAQATIVAAAAALGPVALRSADEPLASKFGPLSIVAFDTSKGTPRHCLGFVRAYDDPLLQMSGWFCRGGEPIRPQHARLRARPADAALRRQRTESRRAVRASRTQSQLLRPARPDSGGDAQIQAVVEGAGDPPGTAAHRPLRRPCAAPARASARRKSIQMQTLMLQRGNNFARPSAAFH